MTGPCRLDDGFVTELERAARRGGRPEQANDTPRRLLYHDRIAAAIECEPLWIAQAGKHAPRRLTGSQNPEASVAKGCHPNTSGAVDRHVVWGRKRSTVRYSSLRGYDDERAQVFVRNQNVAVCVHCRGHGAAQSTGNDTGMPSVHSHAEHRSTR